VGIHEAYETLINRDCKLAVVHPNEEFITRVALYFSFHYRCYITLKKNIPTRQESTPSSSSSAIKASKNTLAMRRAIIQQTSSLAHHM